MIQGAVMAGAERIIGVDTNPRKFALARQLGATDTLEPDARSATSSPAIVELTGGGVDYSFECIGNVEVMGQALACAHKGWGQSIIIGVAGAGEEIHARPFLLVTGRALARHGLRRHARPHAAAGHRRPLHGAAASSSTRW